MQRPDSRQDSRRSIASVTAALWTSAMPWRVALFAALCSSVLAVLYPPGGPSNVVAPPSLPPSSYSPAAVPAPPGRPGEARFGDVVADQFRFAGYSLPLPEGKWRVVASLPSA